MEIHREEINPEISKITLSGRLDMQGAQEIDLEFTALTVTQGGKVIVDISNVSFLASLGLRCLLSAAKALSKKGGKLVLTSPQPNVAEVLKVSGIYQIIKIYDTNEEAIVALS